ncbi:DNA cytosine methyltransferase [Demequina lignilytica]|uniref:Cytosine-specific methyltransferase n=1 Tax=Demequina lignilytica TaxID=3051663 RepID=A0AB35MJR6_9MICO|nr:DNA cytosine methyltransferase [Demequina sp. SYSU T0a273]MDN4484026.1 DNA cytosine methyltransferase [Demequina sp. SYSU T0a273]
MTDTQASANTAAAQSRKRLDDALDYPDVPLRQRSRGRFVSLFAGAGGLDIGLVLAGFEPVWVNEFDPSAFATHHESMARLREQRPHFRQDPVAVLGDISTIASADLPAAGSADLVVGGPPCQGFSVAGKMDPDDPRSRHVFTFFDVVERVQPKVFVLENVKALYANRRWAGTRAAMFARAQELGFNSEMYLLNASHFGVAQARERLVMIGVRAELGEPIAPVPSTASNPPSVRSALVNLPTYGSPGNDAFCKARITLAKSPVMRRSPYAGMLFNGAGRPLDLDRPSSTLAASMGGNKTPIIEQNVLEDPTDSSWVRDYHSALWEGREVAAEREVPSYLRRLTVQEAAEIQTFPRGLHWRGPQSMQFRQIGNAVPPRLGFAVGEAVAAILDPADG